MTPKELKAILKVCQDMGVTKINMEGLEAELELVRAPLVDAKEAYAAASDSLPIAPSEEDLMYWSSGPAQQ